MSKLITLLAALAIGAGTLKAADFTVAIEDPVSGLGAIYIDWQLRKHRLLRYTQQAVIDAENLLEAREIQRRYLASNEDKETLRQYLEKAGDWNRIIEMEESRTRLGIGRSYAVKSKYGNYDARYDEVNLAVRKRNEASNAARVARAETALNCALDGIERNNGKKKPKERSLKQEQEQLRKALAELK